MIKNYLNSCFLLFLLGLLACKPQDRYILETKTAFFLAKDKQSGEKQLLSISKNGANQLKLHEVWGISSQNLGDMTGKDMLFWVSETNTNKLHFIDPTTQTIEKTISLGDISPTLICVGDRHLFIGDSVHQKIAFWNMKSEKLEGLQRVESKPLFAEWNSGKFYTAFADKTLAIYSEDIYSYRNKVSLSNPIVGLLLAVKLNELNLIIQTKNANDSLLESKLEVQADNFLTANDIENAPKPYYQKKRISPYSYAPFGKETTTDIRLLNQKLNLPSSAKFLNQNISNFEMDFFDSEIYAQQNDSLKIYSLPQAAYLQKFAYQGELLKGYYYRDYQGE
ncbi:MAG: hypothetical protein ACKVTZ_23360 [Bacteroidia bacterium]